MKKLLFLMLLIFCIQCASKEPKESCGIVTETVTVPSDTKSKSKNVPISYYSCEYVVIMPQGKDSLVAVKYFKDNNYELLEVSEFNPSVQRYRRRPDGGDTNPVPPKVPPKPIIMFRNTVDLNSQGEPSSLFYVIREFNNNRRM